MIVREKMSLPKMASMRSGGETSPSRVRAGVVTGGCASDEMVVDGNGQKIIGYRLGAETPAAEQLRSAAAGFTIHFRFSDGTSGLASPLTLPHRQREARDPHLGS